MFKSLRKGLIGLSVLILFGFGYHLLANPDNRRIVRQKAVELKEAIARKTTISWSGVAVVREVLEGDTVIVSIDQQPRLRVRLAGVDAPVLLNRAHKPQPLAEESRDYLSNLLQDKAVQMEIVGTDSQTRPLVLMQLDGGFINGMIVDAGLAEAAEEKKDLVPAGLRHELENAQIRAQRKQLGVWGLTNHIRAAEYRIRYP